MQSKSMIAQLALPLGMALMVTLAGCSQETLTVSEVWERAPELDDQQIRVRGWAHVYTDPYVGLIGCPPAGTIENDVVVGRMFLLPEGDSAGMSSGIVVSEASLLCEGDHCGLSCAPFDPGDMAYCSAIRDYETPRQFEMVGTLRVSQEEGEMKLVLEAIKLAESRRLMGETWEPIPTTTVEYWCP
ncbi:MAG: hypothetical protein JXB30_14530 [Anaerolineae bacterium]|nr:hypothetical protein [Anaerolineae bacterium]